MDVDKAIALVSAAGIELTDRRRNGNDDGWSVNFANGAALEIHDSGKMSASGNGADAVAKLLALPAKPGNS